MHFSWLGPRVVQECTDAQLVKEFVGVFANCRCWVEECVKVDHQYQLEFGHPERRESQHGNTAEEVVVLRVL